MARVNASNPALADPIAPDEALARPIPLRIRFSWGLGSLGTIGYINAVSVLVMVYLTTVMKIEPAAAGTMVAAARLVDAFSDPLMGWMTDRTRSRWGRRRPWLLLGSFVCGLGMPLVFSTHVVGTGSGMTLVTMAALIVYSLGFTIFNVPYLTMPVEMTRDRLQRLDLMSFRSVFMMLGAVAGSTGAPLLVQKLGRDADAFMTLGLVAGVGVFVVMIVTFLGTSGVHAEAEEVPLARVSVLDQMRAVLDNRPFMTMVGIKLLQFVALSAERTTSAFFVVMVLKRDFSLLAQLGIATLVSTLVFIPFFRWVGQHVTKRLGLAIGIVGEVLATLSWIYATPEDSEIFFIARGVMSGIFGSAILLFSQAMWLDTIDYDRDRSGLRREGLYTSLYVFIERLGYSFGALFLGFLLQWMNFDKDLPLEQQPASAEFAVMVSQVAIPVAAYGLALGFLWFYRLPERVGGTVRV